MFAGGEAGEMITDFGIDSSDIPSLKYQQNLSLSTQMKVKNQHSENMRMMSNLM